MIYRIVGLSVIYQRCGETVIFDPWRDLPTPTLTAPRARFWFTEAGFRRFGLPALIHPANRKARVIKSKNPRRSRVVYRDRWQVALLPDREVSEDYFRPG